MALASLPSVTPRVGRACNVRFFAFCLPSSHPGILYHLTWATFGLAVTNGPCVSSTGLCLGGYLHLFLPLSFPFFSLYLTWCPFAFLFPSFSQSSHLPDPLSHTCPPVIAHLHRLVPQRACLTA
ncbi:hypothetical protein LX36DRAFT_162324 [Colletotrichum falcatum]|nr:hypothetical protein LX36DRAFT_162324 [Colletotrichum falcatum]